MLPVVPVAQLLDMVLCKFMGWALLLSVSGGWCLSSCGAPGLHDMMDAAAHEVYKKTVWQQHIMCLQL